MPERKYKYKVTGTSDTGTVVQGAKGDFDELNKSVETSGQKASAASIAWGNMLANMGMRVFDATKKATRETIEMTADFETQVNQLKFHSGEAAVVQDQLADAARRVGADQELFGVKSSEAAVAITDFYKAGLKTADIFGGAGGLNAYLNEGAELSGALRAAIDLAAGSDLELAEAGELITTTMITFGIAAEDATKISDNFIQTANAARKEVSDYSDAFGSVANVIAPFYEESQDGIQTLQELNAALAILDQRGIAGAKAGTALRSMFMNMIRDTKRSQAGLSDMNVEMYNTREELKSLPEIIEQISTGALTIEFEGMDQETIDELVNMAQKIRVLRPISMDPFKKDAAAEAADQIAELKQQMEEIIGPAEEGGEAVGSMTESMRNLASKDVAGTYGIQAFLAFASTGAEGYQEMADTIEQTAGAQATAESRLSGLSGALEVLDGTIETFMLTAGTPLIEDFLTPLVREATKIGEQVLPEFEALIDVLTDTDVEKMTPFIAKVIALSDAIKTIKEAGKETQEAWDRLMETLGIGGDKAEKSTEDLVTNLEDMGIAGMQLAKMRDDWLLLVNSFTWGLDMINAMLEGRWKDAWAIAKDIAAGEQEEIAEQTEDMSDTLEEVDLSSAAEGMVDDIVTGLSDPDGKIKAEAEERAADLTTPFEEVDLETEGKNIIEGLKTGLSSKWEESGIGSWVDEKAGIIESRWQAFWESRSPSERAIKLATDVTDGFVEGFEKGTPQMEGPIGEIINLFDKMVQWLTTYAGVVGASGGISGIYDVGEIFEDAAEGIKDLSQAFVNMTEAAATARTFSTDDMMAFLDQYEMFTREAHGRMLKAYKDLGDKDIKRAENAGERLGNMIDGIVKDFSGLKPGNMSDMMTAMDQIEWLMRRTADMVELVVEGDEEIEGIGATQLGNLATWSSQLGTMLGVTASNLSEIEVSEAEDFEATGATFLDQVSIFARLAKDRYKTITGDLKTDYEMAAEAAKYVADLAGLAEVTVAVELPEEDPTANFETHLDYLDQFASMAKDRFKGITGDLKTDYEVAAEAVGLIVGIMDIFGPKLEAELPDPDFEANVGPHLDAIDRMLNPAEGESLPARIVDMAEGAGEALKEAEELVGLIVGMFRILDVGVAKEVEGTGDPMALALERLAYAEALAPQIFETVGRIIDSLTLPEGYEGTKADLLEQYSQFTGWITDMFDILRIDKIVQEATKEDPDTQKRELSTVITETLDAIDEGMSILEPGIRDLMEKDWASQLDTVQAFTDQVTAIFEAIAGSIQSIIDIMLREDLSVADLQTVFNSFIGFLNSPGLIPVLAGAGLPVPTEPAPGGGTMAPTEPGAQGASLGTITVVIARKTFDELSVEQQFDIAIGVDRRLAEIQVESF